MTNSAQRLYWIVWFDWPSPFEPVHGQVARALHDAVVEADWIDEIVAGSGGIGGEQSSLWIFRVGTYAEIERLLKSDDDPVSQAYGKFVSTMENVRDCVRDEVLFL